MENSPPILLRVLKKIQTVFLLIKTVVNCLCYKFYDLDLCYDEKFYIVKNRTNDPVVKYNGLNYIVLLDKLTAEELTMFHDILIEGQDDFRNGQLDQTFGEIMVYPTDPVILKIDDLLKNKYGSRTAPSREVNSRLISYESDNSLGYKSVKDSAPSAFISSVRGKASAPLVRTSRSRSPYVNIPANVDSMELNLLNGWSRKKFLDGSVRYQIREGSKITSLTSVQYYLFLKKGTLPSGYIPRDVTPRKGYVSPSFSKKTSVVNERVKKEEVKKSLPPQDNAQIVKRNMFPDWCDFANDFNFTRFRNEFNMLVLDKPDLVNSKTDNILRDPKITDGALYSASSWLILIISFIIDGLTYSRICRSLIVMKRMIDEKSFVEIVKECGDVYFTDIRDSYVELFFKDDQFRSFVSDQILIVSAKPQNEEQAFSALNKVFHDIYSVVKDKRILIQKSLDKINAVRKNLIDLQRGFNEEVKPIVDEIKAVNSKLSGHLDDSEVLKAKDEYSKFVKPAHTIDAYLLLKKQKKGLIVREEIAKNALASFESFRDRLNASSKSITLDQSAIDDALSIFSSTERLVSEKPEGLPSLDAFEMAGSSEEEPVPEVTEEERELNEF